MLTRKIIEDWLKTTHSEDSEIGIDHDGMCLIEVGTNGFLTGAYLEIGGVPSHIEEAGDPTEVAHKALKLDHDVMRMIVVECGGRSALLSLTADKVLATSETKKLLTDAAEKELCLDEDIAIKHCGEDYSWSDICRFLREWYDWEDGLPYGLL